MAQRCGWMPIGRVALPILNENTNFSRGFEDYALSPPGSNLGTQIESISMLLAAEKNFIFINAIETHYPYLLLRNQVPRISGVHGVVSGYLCNSVNEDASNLDEIPFSIDDMAIMHESQIKAVNLIDKRISYLLDMLKKPIFLLVVSDHGELFGEDGFFGHGPFFHRLLFEVPLAVGIVK